MKKISLIMSGLFLACALTGCDTAMPELTEEENEMITEYAVDLLLKYDRNYDSRLVDLEAYYEKQASLQARMQAQAVEDATKEVAEPEQAASEEQTSGTEMANNTVEEPSASSIEEFYGIEGMEFRYTGYDLTDVYPQGTEDEAMVFFSMDATPGTQLLVLNFQATNTGGGQKDLNMLNYGMRTRINVGDGVSENVLSTMLLNDLQTYRGTLGPNESTELVAVIEVPEGTPIENVSMILRGDAGSATIVLQ